MILYPPASTWPFPLSSATLGDSTGAQERWTETHRGCGPVTVEELGCRYGQAVLAATYDGWVLCSMAQGAGLWGCLPGSFMHPSHCCLSRWRWQPGPGPERMWEGPREALSWRQSKGKVTQDLRDTASVWQLCRPKVRDSPMSWSSVVPPHLARPEYHRQAFCICPVDCGIPNTCTQ